MKKIAKVMLLCLITFVALTSFASYADGSIPNPTNEFYVNDYAGVLDSETEKYIMDTAVALDQATKSQVVVLTVDSLDGMALEDYSLEVLRQWGIGDSKLDNGVLILLAVSDRKSRIEVGYGLEGALPDGKTGRIQDEYMIEFYKNDDFQNGIIGGFTKIVEEVCVEYGIDSLSKVDSSRYYMNSANTSSDDGVNPIIVIIVVVLIILDILLNRGRITRMIIWSASRGSKGSSGGGGGFRGGGGSGGGGGSSRGF